MKKMKLFCCSLVLLVGIFVSTCSVFAASTTKTIPTNKGTMEAWVSGYGINQTNEKATEYCSTMLSGQTTRLYLKSTTLRYSTGATVHSVPRFGGSGKKQINDYFYLQGYKDITVRTYTTHEAIDSTAHTIELSIIY